MSSSRQTQNPQQHPHASIVKALATLGYEPAGAIWNAASRMARAPELVQVMLDYVNIKIPGGYSVASLIRDFEFTSVGAFMMANRFKRPFRNNHYCRGPTPR